MDCLRKQQSASGGSATALIVCLNLIVFAALCVTAGGSPNIDIDTLIRFGANDRVFHQQPWRLLTCTFLHADQIAVLTNMWWLLWSGRVVERRLGSVAFLGVYLSCAVGASLTSAWWNPAAVSVGASGGVWGVWGLILGIVVADVHARNDRQLRDVLLVVVMALLVELGTAPFRPHIDSAAHLGGLLAGFCCGAGQILLIAAHQHRPRFVAWRWGTA